MKNKSNENLREITRKNNKIHKDTKGYSNKKGVAFHRKTSKK